MWGSGIGSCLAGREISTEGKERLPGVHGSKLIVSGSEQTEFAVESVAVCWVYGIGRIVGEDFRVGWYPSSVGHVRRGKCELMWVNDK